MVTSGEATAGTVGVLRVALHHPMRIWVDSMESLLRNRWDIDLVAAHTSTDWVMHAVTTGQADIMILHMAVADPHLAARLDDLRTVNPDLKVVGLSDTDDPRLVLSAVRAGVRGWVEPTVSLDQLVSTLHGVARGETWIPPRLLGPILDALVTAQESREELGTALQALSAREVDILSCLVQGMSRQEIADKYVLSTHTVRTHINNLLRKLGVHSTLAAVSIARQVGLPEQRHKL
jgi:DNA-binding NarL/FixJ family response regulator